MDDMEDMEFHLQQLLKHCRVCGRRLSRAKGRATVYQCTGHAANLLTFLGVDVSSDQEDTFPPHFCNQCYAMMTRVRKAREGQTAYIHSNATFNWTEHTPNCSVRAT